VTFSRAVHPDQRIHVDLCGGGYTFASKEAQAENFDELPISKGGAKFFIVITDEFSRFRRTIPLKRKNEAEKAIREWILELNAKGHKMEAICKDEGSEFGSRKFTKWLKSRGIREENSASYTPEQNDLSERSVGLVCSKARFMLTAINLPASLWAEAVDTATQLLNCSLTRSLSRGMTPFEAFYGYKPFILHFRVFDCVAYARIPHANSHGKLSPRG